MYFEWVAVKELSNIEKHEVPFVDAVESFFDPHGFQMVDSKHSESEKRYYWVGKTKNGRILTTWFTRRDETIRIIGSAEWRKFRRMYDETTKIK